MAASAPLRQQEREAVLLRTYLDVQREQIARGAMLGAGRTVLTRFRWLFVFLGAVQLGLLVACFTVLVNFLIVVMLLHIDVSRYVELLSVL